MNDVQLFSSNEFGSVRTLVINNDPWFVGKDVAVSLGYNNPLKAVRDHVDEDDKGVNEMFTPSGNQNTIVINESGLYSLIFASHLPSAKRFKHWVTSEVLPAIRKTGGYGRGISRLDAINLILKASSKQLPYVIALLNEEGFSFTNVQPSQDDLNPYNDRVDASAEMKSLMIKHHVSLRELEKRTGICKSALSGYWTGKHRPTKERYEHIVNAITQE